MRTRRGGGKGKQANQATKKQPPPARRVSNCRVLYCLRKKRGRNPARELGKNRNRNRPTQRTTTDDNRTTATASPPTSPPRGSRERREPRHHYPAGERGKGRPTVPGHTARTNGRTRNRTERRSNSHGTKPPTTQRTLSHPFVIPSFLRYAPVIGRLGFNK